MLEQDRHVQVPLNAASLRDSDSMIGYMTPCPPFACWQTIDAVELLVSTGYLLGPQFDHAPTPKRLDLLVNRQNAIHRWRLFEMDIIR